MKHDKSAQAWQQALEVLAGGVNSPVRAFNSVGGTPVFIESANGAQLTDVDGNVYIDYVGSWGPAILGHTHPKIIKAVCAQASQGLSFGAPTQLETELAIEVREFFPGMERVRFVNSGTEASMSAIRLARGYTDRTMIVSFAGCYHGHGDSFLTNAGSGLLSLGIKQAVGVVPELAQHTLSLPYNDTDTLTRVFERYGDKIAAVIIEPIAANMNLVLPEAGFLQHLLALTKASGALSIFDEVISGFRVHPGGAQGLYGLQADLTILGKIVGGGMPVGAYGGRKEVMDRLAPGGDVYQAGTLSGNPLAMRAGLETLRMLKAGEVFTQVGQQTKTLIEQMNHLARARKVDLCGQSVGALFGLHFLSQPARNLDEINNSAHQQRYREIFHKMLARGIYLAPSPFESGFCSLSHSQDDIERTLKCFDQSLA